MKIPKGLQPLIDDDVIDSVAGELKSGKEASVYLVTTGGRLMCAKVYKDAEHRGFKGQAAYQEGRKTRRSRDARAMGKGSRHGRDQAESAWMKAEVEALYRVSDAGVRVPRPQCIYQGVLVMELITGDDGRAAPRLNDVAPTPEQAREWHAWLVNQVQRMLCLGLIHGDLSEYNVLLGADGPVIIDMPQAVSAAGNNNAYRMLARDLENIRNYCGAFAPELLETEYAPEMWALYEASELRPDTELTGTFEHDTTPANVEEVLQVVEDARAEAEARELGRLAAEEDER